jgi:hypothetical protein
MGPVIPKDKSSGKRPYASPSIRTEKIYERRSLACGKMPRGFGRSGCARNQRNS